MADTISRNNWSSEMEEDESQYRLNLQVDGSFIITCVAAVAVTVGAYYLTARLSCMALGDFSFRPMMDAALPFGLRAVNVQEVCIALAGVLVVLAKRHELYCCAPLNYWKGLAFLALMVLPVLGVATTIAGGFVVDGTLIWNLAEVDSEQIVNAVSALAAVILYVLLLLGMVSLAVEESFYASAFLMVVMNVFWYPILSLGKVILFVLGVVLLVKLVGLLFGGHSSSYSSRRAVLVWLD